MTAHALARLAEGEVIEANDAPVGWLPVFADDTLRFTGDELTVADASW